MRALLVGNYDIAGKYIAERLYKEGHRISWQTEEPEKELWNASVKGNVYRRELNYRNCSQIIKAESPDCIIFLTQEYRDVYDWTEGRMLNMREIALEVLRAASSIGVHKILYLSSQELETGSILNPALEKLRGGERLCQAVCEQNNIDCLIVRTGIVYGEGNYFVHGFVDGLIRDMMKNRKISTGYAYGSEFDFIYGSDFADAIERLLEEEITGIYTLTSGYPIPLQKFYGYATKKTGYKIPVKYGIKAHKAPQQDSYELKRLTGWLPFHMFDETMPEVMGRYEALYSESHRGKTVKQKEHDFVTVKETLQNFAAFLIFMALDYFATDWSDLRFVDVKLLYVVIISLSFGMKQGIVAIILAIIAYFAKMFYAQVDMTYVFYSIDTWVPFIIYGVAGAVVGYISDKKNDDLENREEEFQSLNEKYNFLKSMYQEVLNVKNQLQKQIMISKDSLGHIYEITEELDDTRPRTVMIRAVKVVEETMECTSVAIFTRAANSSFGRLMACSGDIARDMTGSINFSDYEEMEEVLVQGEMYVNTGLLEHYPSFAMPVMDGENMVAVVMIFQLDPGKYTIHYKNLFQTLILIMRNCLVRAYNYQEENRDKLYLGKTNILRSEEFRAELESIQQASDELQYPYSLGRVVYDNTVSFTEMAERLSRSIRATDISGCDENGNVYIILLFVGPSLRGYTEQRFEKAGLKVIWEN